MRDTEICKSILNKLLEQSRKENDDFWQHTDVWASNAKESLVLKPGYFNRTVLGKNQLSALLRHDLNICQKTPFFCCRVGNTECTIIGQYLEKCCGYRRRYGDTWRGWLLKTSGFFSDDRDDSDIDRYVEMLLDAIPLSDIFLCWHPRFMDLLGNYIASEAILAVNEILDYDINGKSWVSGLEGKRVLVVSAFSKSIQYQYARRELLCKHPGARLPEFELMTYQMLQTQCNNRNGFANWFDAYQKVEDEVLAMEFDVAIVGAGAYAVPLCASIKRSGRSVIETCGLTPAFFGIAGKRHREDGTFARCGTEAWIKPLEEPPQYASEIEDGCYW